MNTLLNDSFTHIMRKKLVQPISTPNSLNLDYTDSWFSVYLESIIRRSGLMLTWSQIYKSRCYMYLELSTGSPSYMCTLSQVNRVQVLCVTWVKYT